VVRHRLSLAGNRKLNNALHMVANCQARSDVRGRAYYSKKIAEGKSRKEALRCLKRRISDAVFKRLMADVQGPSFAALRLTKRSLEGNFCEVRLEDSQRFAHVAFSGVRQGCCSTSPALRSKTP
jgi:transposase